MGLGLMASVAVGVVALVLMSTTAAAIALGLVTFVVLSGLLIWLIVTQAPPPASTLQPPSPHSPERGDSTATSLKTEFLRRTAARLLRLSVSPSLMEGEEPRPHRVNQLLDYLFEYFIQDYVETWYDLLSPDDPEIGKCSKETFWALTDRLQKRLENVDWVTFLTRDVVMIVTTHLQTLRQTDSSLEHFPSHPALVSDEAEIRYIREMAEVFLQCVLPPEDAQSSMYLLMLRELLTEILYRNVNMVADYDYVNQCIGARGDQLTQELEQKRGKANAFSSQKAILKAIAKSDDTDEVEEIRFKIISEMMQIKHIENLKRDATSSEERAALERLLAMDPKAAQLKSRNLSRYIHELRHVKRECERRLAQLGGPDYRVSNNDAPIQIQPGGAEGAGTADGRQPRGPLTKMFGSIGGRIENIGGTIKGTLKEVMTLEDMEGSRHTDSNLISLPEIIGSIGIGYFMEYLRKLRAMKNIKFWISCNTLLKLAESTPDIPCGLVRNVYEVVTSRAEDKSQLQLKRETLDSLAQTMSRCCAHGCDDSSYCTEIVPRAELVTLVRAQREVYRYLYDTHYRKFVFSDEYSEYIRKNETACRRGMPKEGPGPDGSFDPQLGPGVLAMWYYEAAGEERYDRTRCADADLEASLAEADWGTEWIQWSVAVLAVHDLNSTGTSGGATVGGRSASTVADCGSFEVDLSVTVTAQDGSGREWVITRTAVDFTALHTTLAPLSSKLPTKPPWIDEKRRWGFMGSTTKAAAPQVPAAALLDEYLRGLLQDAMIKESEALFTFLKPVRRPEPRGGSRRGSRQASPMPDSVSPPYGSRRSSPVPVDAIDPDLDGVSDEDDKDSIAEPMYGLVSEIFVLKGMFKWLRRQAIFFVKLTYGASINTYVESSIDWLKAEDQLVFYLEYFRDTMFPQEWTPPPPRTHEEKVHMQEYAQEKLQVIVGNAVASIGLIGNRNAVRGADALFSALQSTHANKHLIYSILEKLMEHVLPEITPRNLSQNLVVLNAN